MRDDGLRPAYISVGVSRASDVAAAITEAVAGLDPPTACFVLAFVPDHLAPEPVSAALDAALGGVPVFGCTTAGQITPMGYENDALLLLAFSKAHFRCASLLLEPLNPLSIAQIATDAKRHAEKFQHTAGWSRLALVLSDGVSKQEDLVVSTLETVLDGLPVFGGSAGDGLRFEQTFVLHQGRAHSDAALLLLLETNLRFQGLGFDHFLPADVPVIITDADPEQRLVYEINGAPAALEYARLVGSTIDDLSPQIFAENPLLVRHARNHYVRAISNVTGDQALSFLAAIDDGLIMTLGRGQEIIETARAGLGVRDAGGEEPAFILGFDCVLRKLEIEQKQLSGAVSNVLRDHRVYGFNTYGEQHRGVHMNQTFVGVAFFDPEPRVLF